MNVLSVFDGMSCGQIALNRLRIPYDNYFASEIDKHAIAVTQKNYPKTIQLGDVRNINADELPVIDLFFGGSPCQGFSFAGKGLNFDDPRSKLFFEYVRILEQIRKRNPEVKFLLENVKMKKECEDVISMYLGVKPIFINSALVSAQNRQRLYWTNIEGVKVPEDRGILLSHIIESGFVDRDKSYCIDANYFKGGSLNNYIEKKRRQIVLSQSENRLMVKEKSQTILATIHKENAKSMVKRGKMGLIVGDDNGETIAVRKLTVLECERLQTVPEGYTSGVSNTQRYRMLGNGWTVDVIAHLFANLKASQVNKAA